MAESSTTRDVSPIYVKPSDLPEIDERELALLLCQTLDNKGDGNINGAQLIDGIWSIWINSARSRTKLLEEVKVVSIKKHRVQLYDDFPIVTRRAPTEKVLFKDLPFQVRDEDILDYLYSRPDIQIKTKHVLMARMRNEQRELTQYYSGDRFIYIKAGCQRVLPSIADIGKHKCRIIHPSQQKACRRCLYTGHSMHDFEMCNAYQSNNEIITIRSPNNVLCNLYTYMYDKTFMTKHFAQQNMPINGSSVRT